MRAYILLWKDFSTVGAAAAAVGVVGAVFVSSGGDGNGNGNGDVVSVASSVFAQIRTHIHPQCSKHSSKHIEYIFFVTIRYYE